MEHSEDEAGSSSSWERNLLAGLLAGTAPLPDCNLEDIAHSAGKFLECRLA